MIKTIRRFLGLKPPTDWNQLYQSGAVILDVRTPQEFKQGHIKDAHNIPLDRLGEHLKKFPDKGQHYITVCASGMRSGAAKRIMRGKGYENVYNGGAWISLGSKIKER